MWHNHSAQLFLVIEFGRRGTLQLSVGQLDFASVPLSSPAFCHSCALASLLLLLHNISCNIFLLKDQDVFAVCIMSSLSEESLIFFFDFLKLGLGGWFIVSLPTLNPPTPLNPWNKRECYLNFIWRWLRSTVSILHPWSHDYLLLHNAFRSSSGSFSCYLVSKIANVPLNIL